MSFLLFEPESLLRICAFLYPLLAGYSLLGAEFVDLFNGYIFHHQTLNLLRGTLALLILVTSGLLYLLQIAIQQRVLHVNKIRIYSVVFCLLFFITKSVHIVKGSKVERIQLGNFSVGIVGYLYYCNFIVQFISIVQFLNDQKDRNNPPSTFSKIFVRILLALYCFYQWGRSTHLLYVYRNDIFGRISTLIKQGEEKYLSAASILCMIQDACFVGFIMITCLLFIGIYKKKKWYIKLYLYMKFILYVLAGGLALVANTIRFKSSHYTFMQAIKFRYRVLGFRLLYIFETWLVLLFINHLDWRNVIGDQEKFETDGDGGTLAIDNFTELKSLDKKTKKMIKSLTVAPWRFTTGDELGEGNFGKVYKGLFINVTSNGLKKSKIAVKILKHDQINLMKALLSEIKSLLLVQTHPNLIKIFGLAWKESCLCILMEYCSLRNLEGYLLKLRRESNFPQNIVQNELQQINQWALEIASAMEFIGTKKIVHADLAARNVLLDANKVAKLTDFGMSIRLYNYQLYAKSNAEFLPWRWMAPEALSDLKFSSKSDVWAFGVTLWEIFSFGNSPWQNFEWSSDFVGKLQNGLQLGKPEFISEYMYSRVMKKCWLVDENKRITFPEIIQFLKVIKNKELSESGQSHSVLEV